MARLVAKKGGINFAAENILQTLDLHESKDDNVL